MNPLPRHAVLEAARRLAEPDDLMKFTLIYDGDLPSAGNHPKPIEASLIRNIFHDQLADLWDSNVILRRLRHEGRVYNQWMGDLAVDFSPDYADQPPPLGPHQIDLCAPIQVPAARSGFVPIRSSLALSGMRS